MTLLGSAVALLAQLVAGQTSPATLTAVGLVGVTLLLLAWAVRRPAVPHATAPAVRFRQGAEHVPFVRLLHPAAAGRPRPRAPSPGPAPVARPGTP
ncbi:DUF6412 domain-containing protein [Sphaerisporangium aureirubrum]|uniref:DUF6412 domain-containing protein n=1 Tax=Sphaerisporangium aureirubrum TaxID=1544736 RepID=A0ABW1NK00_9ACTN